MALADASDAPEWLAGNGTLWGHLIPASRQTLGTAAQLQRALTSLTNVDWSCVITLVFKAIELELHVRVLQPFRLRMREATASRQFDCMVERLQSDRWLRPLGVFLAGNRPPTLAATANYFAALVHVAADTPDNPLATLKSWLRARWPRAHHLWGPNQVARKLEAAVSAYRNPYVHGKVANRADVEDVLTLLWGRPTNQGICLQTLRALSSGLPVPELTQERCAVCAVYLWHYAQRVPAFHCPNCATMTDSVPTALAKEPVQDYDTGLPNAERGGQDFRA